MCAASRPIGEHFIQASTEIGIAFNENYNDASAAVDHRLRVQLFGLILIISFPQIALWLPEHL